MLSSASTDLTTSEEVLLYPFVSLVTDFGGALGLFLGFSFLAVLDCKARFETTNKSFARRIKDIYWWSLKKQMWGNKQGDLE